MATLLLRSLLLLTLLQRNSANPLAAQKGNPGDTPHPTGRTRIIYRTVAPDDEYIYDETDESDPVPSQRPALTRELNPKLCDYDRCRDEQVPCELLSESSGCLCPGLSGPRVPPNPPELRSVVREGSAVVARWCSPASAVLHYRVTVRGGSPATFGERSRKGVLGQVEPGATVCVEALNAAGSSEKSCRAYEPPEDGDLALKAGLTGGALCLLLLLSLAAVLLWRRKARRKAESSSEGVGNPSYSKDGTM
ncbi:LRRN4 C-terminal-like protein [Scleropages formosus]|uniref:LRRN4 C-terminal-like protein n=1 Tax=Scleropages formosus TaxID=113540 RepID=A0A8C9U9M9_SCLFO|nr:LRRN4 C-terminal-like protein [Scleropages formosus]